MKTVTSANDGSLVDGAVPAATGTVAPVETVAAGPIEAVPPATQVPPPAKQVPPLGTQDAPPAADAGETTEAIEAAEDQTPFWMPWHPHWPSFPTRGPRHPAPRRPVLGIFALVVLGLMATFFAWVSAEPIWLAVGHGERGTATATQCTVESVPYRCVIFTAAGGRYVAEDVTLLGTEHGRLRQGTSVPAAMVSPDSTRAYAVDAEGLRLRSAAGLVALLLCGLGIAWATGAGRLEPTATRRRAFLACVGAPLLLALAFLATTW